MALKVFKPVTPGQRFKSVLDYSVISKKEPERNLLEPLKKTGGRSHGKVAVRGRGGGAKRLYRIIDFKRDKLDLPAKVEAIEYDPNRTVNIALIHYPDGEKRYILAPEGLKVGEEVLAGEKVEIKIGNATSLKNIPVGTPINNVELVPGRGGQIAKSAGSSAMISAKEGKFAHVKLPSGELRKINLSCLATIGQLSNVDWKNVKLGKAGRKRYLGKRPKVRGVAMDPGSHPHGGGEGKSGIGMPSPKSPWGWRTLGRKTRRPGKPSDKFILERRRK